jgi:hypothetical protein
MRRRPTKAAATVKAYTKQKAQSASSTRRIYLGIEARKQDQIERFYELSHVYCEKRAVVERYSRETGYY